MIRFILTLKFLLFFLMCLLDWRRVLFPPPDYPNIPNLTEIRDDTLYFDSFSRGVGISGDPGTGKTTWDAIVIIDYALMYPDRPIFIFDASESLTNEFIEIYHSLPPAQRDAIDRRIVFDRPGDEHWVVTKPSFSPDYGLSDEEQIQKATNIVEELNPERLERNPSMSSAITETAPNLFRLLQKINDVYGSWQITEAKRLLIDTFKNGLLERACKRFGGFVPNAKWYLEKQLLRKEITATALEARTASLIGALGVIESDPLRARYGYFRPGITVKEIIDKGLIYIVSGAKLTNQKKAQAWVYWDEYASLKAIINKRSPHDPNEKPVLLVIDEVYQLFEIKGMAKEIGLITSYYRSRKLQLMIIIQAFWQLDDKLKEQFWNLGNLVTFSLDNFDDAYKFAQQVFMYDPSSEKFPARSEIGQPIVEHDRGQYLTAANWIQNLKWRQMVMRRYLNEREKEQFVGFVRKTREKPMVQLPEPLDAIKDKLLRRWAVEVNTALEVVNERSFKTVQSKKSKKRRTTNQS